MNSFTIRDMENLCGIRAHTLRAWEQRYGFLPPKRKPGNHRIYDAEDLKYLLRISYLYHKGHKISRIARLCSEDLCHLTHNESARDRSGDFFVNRLMEASIDLDKEAFEKALNNLILQMGFEKAACDILWKFLDQLGLFWLTGNVIPAQEHFASYLIIHKLMEAIEGLPSPVRKDRRILIFSPQEEFHEMPLLLTQYLLLANGHPVIYFGKNTSISEIEYYTSRRSVTHLFFHLVTHLAKCDLNEYIQQLSEKFPSQKIVFSGPLTQKINSSFRNLTLLTSFEQMRKFGELGEISEH